MVRRRQRRFLTLRVHRRHLALIMVHALSTFSCLYCVLRLFTYLELALFAFWARYVVCCFVVVVVRFGSHGVQP